VNAANTSQVCHECGSKVTHPEHKVSLCPKSGAKDRDVNAAMNIAARAVPKVNTARNTRAKNRKLQKKTSLKTPTPPTRTPKDDFLIYKLKAASSSST